MTLSADERLNGGERGRGWRRALALFAVVMTASVLRPGPLLALPALLLLVARRAWTGPTIALALIAIWSLVLGPHDDVWYFERAWALVLGGWFVALAALAPSWRHSSRAVASTLAAVTVIALALLVSDGAWAALDWRIGDGIRAGLMAALDAMTVLRQGRPLSPAFVATMYEMADLQVMIYPALVALTSVAALGVAWWTALRLTGGGDDGLGPVTEFRFNDHLVWLLIGGLGLLLARGNDHLVRIGANLAVFMGALYAVRGAGVVVVVTGGLSMLAYAALAVAMVVTPRLVLATAALIGIGDTWLDLRSIGAPGGRDQTEAS